MTTGGTTMRPPTNKKDSKKVNVTPCILTGNVGRDPEMKYTPNGNPVTSFSLAVYSGKTMEEEVLTTWVRVIGWGDTGEAMNREILKGQQVTARGYLKIETWERQDASVGINVELTAFEYEILRQPKKKE